MSLQLTLRVNIHIIVLIRNEAKRTFTLLLIMWPSHKFLYSIVFTFLWTVPNPTVLNLNEKHAYEKYIAMVPYKDQQMYVGVNYYWPSWVSLLLLIRFMFSPPYTCNGRHLFLYTSESVQVNPCRSVSQIPRYLQHVHRFTAISWCLVFRERTAYVSGLLVFAGGARGLNALGPESLKSIFHCSVKRIYVVCCSCLVVPTCRPSPHNATQVVLSCSENETKPYLTAENHLASSFPLLTFMLRIPVTIKQD